MLTVGFPNLANARIRLTEIYYFVRGYPEFRTLAQPFSSVHIVTAAIIVSCDKGCFVRVLR